MNVSTRLVPPQEVLMLQRLLLGAILILGIVPPAHAGPDLTGVVEMDVNYGPEEALVTFTFTFENNGDAFCDASKYWIDFWGSYTCECDTNPMFCGTAPASDQSWEITDPEILGPGTFWSPDETLVLSYPYSPEPYRFMLFVDSLFSCNEGGNEANNFICGEFIIDDTVEGGADLEIMECTAGQDPDFPAGVLFTAVVRNNGVEATPVDTDVDFFMLDSPPIDGVDPIWGTLGADFAPVVAGLGPQEEILITSTLSECTVGWHYPLFTVNGFEAFPEANWEDNWCIPDPPQYECTENVLLPDLVLKDVGIDQEVLDASGLIRLTGKIRNQGLVAITAQESYKLCIYEDWPQKPGECEVPEQGVNGWIEAFNNGLGPGLEQEFDKVSELAQEGLHDYWFRVDCDCADPEYGEILESDEKNNEEKLDNVLIPVEGPDLAISVFQAAVLPIDGKNVIRYIIEVINIGTEPITKDIEVDLFRDYPSDLPPDFDSILAAIDAGETWPENAEFFAIPGGLPANGGFAQAEFSDWQPEGDGTYTPWVVIDVVNNILEANETNNAATINGGIPYEALAPTEGPNLSIEDFTGQVAGNRVTYKLVVRNTGDEVAIGPFRMDLFTDRQSPPNLFEWSEFNITVDELSPGDAAPWTYEWEDVPDGIYRSYALVDTDNVVAETEEGDNLAGFLLIDVGAVQCPEGEITLNGCLCGGEPQFLGFCCDGEWSAVSCAPGDIDRVETDGDVVADMDPELITSFGSAGGDCGCRHAAPAGFPGGPVLLLALLGALVLALRRRTA
jgi:hypothetical protein